MTTKVTIKAEIHDQQKLVRVQVATHGTVGTTVDLKSGEETEQYVWDGQTIAVSEVDAPAGE